MARILEARCTYLGHQSTQNNAVHCKAKDPLFLACWASRYGNYNFDSLAQNSQPFLASTLAIRYPNYKQSHKTRRTQLLSSKWEWPNFSKTEGYFCLCLCVSEHVSMWAGKSHTCIWPLFGASLSGIKVFAKVRVPFVELLLAFGSMHSDHWNKTWHLRCASCQQAVETNTTIDIDNILADTHVYMYENAKHVCACLLKFDLASKEKACARSVGLRRHLL